MYTVLNSPGRSLLVMGLTPDFKSALETRFLDHICVVLCVVILHLWGRVFAEC